MKKYKTLVLETTKKQSEHMMAIGKLKAETGAEQQVNANLKSKVWHLE
jgi:hypothetical protein